MRHDSRSERAGGRRRRRCSIAAVLVVGYATTFASAAEVAAQSYIVKPPQTTPGATRAQPRPQSPATSGRPAAGESNPADKTTVSIEVVADEGALGLAAQQWQQEFAKLGIGLRIRRALPGDKPGVEEKTQGTLRQVVVTAYLGRDGKIGVNGRSFGPGDSAKLGEWIDELKTYGAQGAPEGQPMWGLSQAQFSQLSRGLTAIVENEVEGKPLEESLGRLGIPDEHPVRLSTAARDWLAEQYGSELAVRQEVSGFSRGTALALLLNDFGLGFRPLRTPRGDIELTIEPLTKTTDVWPVGWPAKVRPALVAPKLYEFVTAGFEEARFTDVLAAMSERTDVPVRIDRFRAAAIDVDVDQLLVTFPRQRTTWSLLLRSITAPAKLSRDIRVDEEGRPFVWIAPIVPARAMERLRGAENPPGK
ncbi:MAG: hypothetical protein WD066_17245 [Planctomycetaceae bacterium]